MSQVVTRIAPSPTGFMHIGTARTALFNWLYARGRNGKFFIRIEDTDRKRSTAEANEVIINGLNWLGLDYDGDIISQFERAPRHVEIAEKLLKNGKAYKCFASSEEIQIFKEKALKSGASTLFKSPWRNADSSSHPDSPYVIRIKAPETGETIIQDEVQGKISIKNNQLDDMVLLRSDGSPVYMLAVVVDDHDMGITHVIRGDDHLNNAARQNLIYEALEWNIPVYAHIPLIHGEDGKKMSKRHGATSIEEYELSGYPARGLRNYLARLGWSHGDEEYFTDQQALEWFNLIDIGKSAARFDLKKLQFLSGQHLKNSDDAALLHETLQFLTKVKKQSLSEDKIQLLNKGLYCLKDRVKTLSELIEKASFILDSRPIEMSSDARLTLDETGLAMLEALTPHLQNATWARTELEQICNNIAESFGVKFGKLASPIRSALSGQTKTPSVFDMMLVLGRNETIARLTNV
ncbi:MAG: glutamate--tRNA ligase [Paracoccaceae bacterium]